MGAKIAKGEIIFDPTTDTIDIVCHSMGFAYAQGMVEVFKQLNFKLGSYYILAPENGCSGSVSFDDFKGEIWQYGSNLGMTNSDPLWLQDGVAPQCAIVNIETKPDRGGRVGTPPSPGFNKDFVASHSIKNFGWIFSRTLQQTGYVKKRH